MEAMSSLKDEVSMKLNKLGCSLNFNIISYNSTFMTLEDSF